LLQILFKNGDRGSTKKAGENLLVELPVQETRGSEKGCRFRKRISISPLPNLKLHTMNLVSSFCREMEMISDQV